MHRPTFWMFKNRQLRYDTHTVKAKHASVDALTPQESGSKMCPTDTVSRRRKRWLARTSSRSRWFMLYPVDHADRGKGSRSKKRERVHSQTRQL